MNRNVAAIVFAFVVPTVVTLIYFVWLRESAPAAKQIAYAAGKTIQFSFPLLFVWFCDRAFIRKRTPAADERPPAHALPLKTGYLTAIAFGMFIAVAIPVVYFVFIADSPIAGGLLERVKEKTIGNGIDTPFKFIALGVFYAICHSFLEEYYWRWFVFGQLKRLVPLAVANFVSSVGFMAHHFVLLAVFFEGWTSPLTWLFSSTICIGGMFWAWLYHRTGSLKTVWVSHLLVDAGIFFLGYLLIRELF